MDRTRAWLVVAGLLFAVASLPGCGSGSASADGPAPEYSHASATPLRPASCTAARSRAYTIAGRTYLLTVPTDLRRATGLLLDLHGYGQDAAAQEHYTGFASYAAARGFVVVTPDGQPGGQWNFPRSPALADDVGFVNALVADVRRRLCGAVTGGVGAVGWSDGADMAATLGCAGVVDAVAGVAASVFPTVACPKPPPVVEIHGTADTFVPFAGGGGSRNGAFANTEAQPVEARLGRWATSAGCPQPPQEVAVAADVELKTWGTCAALYRVDDGGHTWPGHSGADPVPGLGATTESINANQLFVDFLERHL